MERAPFASSHPLERFLLSEAPCYRPFGDEIARFEAACREHLPMIVKGPTGCGKTRFVEYMAWKLGLPLVPLACNEDTSASDLVGRFLLDGNGTWWADGPLTLAARHGGICYLDEIVEAREDTTVAIHPLADARRVLPLDRKGELVHAHPDFHLVMSYNPGYQGGAKRLKPSTRQRFVALEFGYGTAEHEIDVVIAESGVTPAFAQRLVDIAQRSAALIGDGLDERVSTRMLVHAARLAAAGLAPRDACRLAISDAASDDADARAALRAFVDAHFAA